MPLMKVSKSYTSYCLIGAKYEFTYNDNGKFSQLQLFILFNVPSLDNLNNLKKPGSYCCTPRIIKD